MYSNEFIKAFNFAMSFEVGRWFNPNDPVVKAGSIDNKVNRLACGYVNDPSDNGGETKFGIAQKANPDICVATLTLEQAQKIYFDRYWIPAKCDKIPSPLSLLHFDTAVNMGVGAAAKLLQTALGTVVDGDIGPVTLSKIATANLSELCTKYLNLKQARYDAIVKANPSQARFAKGWKARNDAMRSLVALK